MKKSTAVLWILVLTAILAGTYAKIHDSEIRRLTSHDSGPCTLSARSPGNPPSSLPVIAAPKLSPLTAAIPSR